MAMNRTRSEQAKRCTSLGAGPVAAASAVALVLVLCAPAARAAVAAAWSVQPTPNPAGAENSVLSSVSCASPTACTSVGHYTSRGGAGMTLAERWDGARWSIEPTPRPAGARTSLLFGVSCVSRACVAVGSATNHAGVTEPLAERWNGTRWTIQRTPTLKANGDSVSYLSGISCASPSSCTAVGYSGNSEGTSGAPLAEHWNGVSWALQRTPHPVGATVGFLPAVSCVSPRSCIAVGFFINHASAGFTLAERWDGIRWSIQRTPTPQAAAYVQLVGVSCRLPGPCMAAGFFSIDTGIEIMLAEASQGPGWSIQRTLYPAGATGVRFSGVSCASPRSCTAVGFFGDAAGLNETLAERWNGTDWVIQQTPHPAGAMSTALAGVSCPSPTACTAVGSFTNSAGTEVTLAERYS
jgi:hypothetical protein